MPKFLGHYRIQPRIRRKLDGLVVLEPRQLFDHATRRWLEHHPDVVLRRKCQGSGKNIAHLFGTSVRGESSRTLTSARPSTLQGM